MRFMLFAGYNYYPSGGIDDLIGMYSTREEAEEHYSKIKDKEYFDWYQIFDILLAKVVA